MLGVAASPTDKTYADQLRGAAILEAEWERQPEHPGIVHYLIHLYDYPPLAARGVRAAERYATLAADASHALHMPSHIFTRIGRWEDSVESNRRSAERAVATNDVDGEWHALDYMVYAFLQTGQDAAARRALESAGRARSASHAQRPRLRRRGHAGAPRAGARRLGRGRGAAPAGERLPLRGRAHALRPRPRPRPLGPRRRSRRRHRGAAPHRGCAADARQLLGRAGGHPARGGRGRGAVRRRAAGGGPPRPARSPPTTRAGRRSTW
jgi:hypothetical protein